MSSVSLRMRILLGFITIIIFLGAVNLLSVFKLHGLDDASAKIIERTKIVRYVNDYVSDILTQASSLRTFAFSAHKADKMAVEKSQVAASESWKKVSYLLLQSGEGKIVSEIKTAAEKFELVFANIEHRLGNEADAVQVAILGLGSLRGSSAGFLEFLSSKEITGARDIARALPPVIARIEQYGVAYAVSSRTADFEKVITAGNQLAGIIGKAKKMLRKLPRRDRAKLRFMSRDWDVIRQSLRQKNAISISLDEAMIELSDAAADITAITSKVKKDAQNAQSNSLEHMVTKVSEAGSEAIIGLVAGGVISIILAWVIGASIATPLTRITKTMASLADGNKLLKIPYQDRQDEIGRMAKAATIFKDKAFELEKIAAQKMEAEIKNAESQRRRKQEQEIRIKKQEELEASRALARQQERHEQQLKLADQLESEVVGVVTNITAMTSQLGQASANMKSNVDKTNCLSITAAGNSEQTKSNVLLVSRAMEEMEQVLAEASTQADKSRNMAGDAVEIAEQSQIRMSSLAQSTNKITNVVKLIQDIAEQTKLLALNATIEAARAGETGKGFAVVANEVKGLAAQTARATKEIENQVSSVIDATRETVDTTNTLKLTIEDMNEMSQMISSSVNEQVVTSRTIKNCVGEASDGVDGLQKDIHSVNQMAKSSEDAASNVWQATSILENQAEALDMALDQFLRQIRTPDQPSDPASKMPGFSGESANLTLVGNVSQDIIATATSL